MLSSWVVIAISFVLPLLTLFYVVIGRDNKAETAQVDELAERLKRVEAKLDETEDRLTTCEEDRKKLSEAVKLLSARIK